MFLYVIGQKFFLIGNAVAFFTVAVFPGQADISASIKIIRHIFTFFSLYNGDTVPLLWRSGGYVQKMCPDETAEKLFRGDGREKLSLDSKGFFRLFSAVWKAGCFRR